MAGIIFYRKRRKEKEGSKTPRFRVVAVSGCDTKIYSDHFRKKELEKIAEMTGAQLLELERDQKSDQ